MIKKIFWFCAATAAFVVAEAAVCNYADKHPRVKNVVDKLKKMGKDFSDDCQEVVGAVLCAPATEVV
ncbi:MAG: hypothetical protein J6V90_00360 [Treponema sp.]|nr:hypothetical protein [Treponema sp.]